MVSRRVSWVITVAACAAGFAGARALARAGAPSNGADASAPTTTIPAPAPQARAPQAAPVGQALPRKAASGVDLYRQVAADHPDAVAQTFSSMNVAVTRTVEAHVKRHGGPAQACAPDGSFDDAILTVQWRVSTEAGGVHVRGGTVVIDQFPEPVHACLQDYLSKIEGDFPTPVPLAELEVLYQWPIPALVVLAKPATPADAGVAAAGG